MKTIAVTHIPESFEAHQFDGEVDIDLARWCKGRYEANPKGDGWILHIGQSQIVYPGQWIIINVDGHFFKVTNEVFEKEFIRKDI